MKTSHITKLDGFIDYVLSFYGKGEIYDIGMTREEVLKATHVRLTNSPYNAIPFDGDTIDREMVRDIVIEMRG